MINFRNVLCHLENQDQRWSFPHLWGQCEIANKDHWKGGPLDCKNIKMLENKKKIMKKAIQIVRDTFWHFYNPPPPYDVTKKVNHLNNNNIC